MFADRSFQRFRLFQMFDLRNCLFQIMQLKFHKLLNNLSCIAVSVKHPHPALLFKFFILIVLNFLILFENACAGAISKKYLKHRHSIFKLLVLFWQYAHNIFSSAFMEFPESYVILFFSFFLRKNGNNRLLKHR